MAVAATIIGTYIAVTKFILQDIEPVLSIALRNLGVAGVIALITWSYQHKPVSFRCSRLLIFNGCLHGLQSMMFVIGLERTQAINGSLLWLLLPVFIYIGSIVFLREPFKGQALLGALVSLTGGLLLVLGPLLSEGGEVTFNWGDMLMLGAVFILSINILQTKTLYQYITPHQILIYKMLMSGIALLVGSALLGESFDVSQVSWQAWVALAYSIIFTGAIGLLLFYGALRYMRAEDSASFIYIEPLMGVITSAVFLGESLDETALIAGSVIVLGVLITHPAHVHRLHFYQAPKGHHENILRRLMAVSKQLANVKKIKF